MQTVTVMTSYLRGARRLGTREEDARRRPRAPAKCPVQPGEERRQDPLPRDTAGWEGWWQVEVHFTTEEKEKI